MKKRASSPSKVQIYAMPKSSSVGEGRESDVLPWTRVRSMNEANKDIDRSIVYESALRGVECRICRAGDRWQRERSDGLSWSVDVRLKERRDLSNVFFKHGMEHSPMHHSPFPRHSKLALPLLPPSPSRSPSPLTPQLRLLRDRQRAPVPGPVRQLQSASSPAPEASRRSRE